MGELHVFVTGGRDGADKRLIWHALDEITDSMYEPEIHVHHGTARGTDRIAGAWARARGKVEHPHPADWERYPRAGGVVRNGQMASLAENLRTEGHNVIVVAFPGGNGTANMIRAARQRRLPVITVRP